MKVTVVEGRVRVATVGIQGPPGVGISQGYVDAGDTASRNRANHTGTQLSSTISDFATSVDGRVAIQKGASNGLATLGSDGKVPTSQLPANTINTVLSVNGQTGAVNITAAGIGALAAANNLSDLGNAGTARANLGVAIGADVQAYSANLSALGAMTSTGLMAQTASGAYTARSIVAGSPSVVVTNGNGVAGNPTVDLAAATGSLMGGVVLAGDLGGTAASPTVPGLAAKAAITYVDTQDALNLAKSSNLSDLASASSARTNLGLGTAATVADSTLAHLAGTETITGAKTFNAGTLKDKGNIVFDARAYGVVGDGTTNDGPAFQAAHTAAAAAGGGVVWAPIPAVAYKISSSFTISSNTVLRGAGYGCLFNVATGASIRIDGTSNAGIENIHADGLNQSGNDAVINFKNTTHSWLRSSWITNANAFGVFIHSTGTSTTSQVWIEDNQIGGLGNADVIGGGPTNSTGAVVKDIFVNRNFVTQDTTISGAYPSAFDMVAAQAISVQGNKFYGNVTFGFEQFNHLDADISHNTVRPAIGLLAGTIGVNSNTTETSPDKGITIVGNTLDGCQIFLSASGSTKKMSGVTVVGNTVRAWSTQDAISLYNCSSGVVTGNTCISANPAAQFNAGVRLITSDNIMISGNAFIRANYGVKDDTSEPTILIGQNSYTTINIQHNAGGTVLDDTYVHTSAAETIAGVKTFSSAPIFSTLNGLLKGNGASAVSAATSGTDYSAGTSALATGILKSTTATGALSIAVAADFPTLNQNTTGSAATLTTPRAIYGNSFDGSAALTQVIASTYGGTGNGFAKFNGPASSEKTFTLPNASATILTDNSVVTIGQGGTGSATQNFVDLTTGQTIGGSKVLTGVLYVNNNDSYFGTGYGGGTGGQTHIGNLGTNDAWVDTSSSATNANLQLRAKGTGSIVANNSLDLSTKNLITDTTTGTKIGTATTQKLGFYNSTPIVQPSGNALAALSNLGLVSSPTLAESDVTNLTSDLALKAPLASPTFTGTLSAAALTTSGAVTHTIASAGNAVALTINQNDTTNNPTALSVSNTGSGLAGDLVMTSSGATAVVFGLRNNATATNTAVTLRFANTTLATASATGAGTGEITVIRSSSPGAGDSEMLFKISSGGSILQKFRVSAAKVTLADAVDMVIGTTTGTKIGTATSQKLGFWNATPIVQPSGANQAAITDSTGGTAGFTLSDVTASHSQSVLNNNFASLNRQLDAIRTALVAAGIIKGAA